MNRATKSLLILFLISILMFLLVGCGGQKGATGQQPSKQETQGEKKDTSATKAEFTIRFGHANEPTDASIFHVVALKFKELTEKYSNGRIQVEIYPSAQLGGEQEMVRNCQLGTQEVTEVSIANLNPYSKSLYFLSLPYIFDSVEQGRAVANNMMEQINQWAINEAGVRILSFQDAGFRVLSNSKKPVKKLADLQGLKIRIPQNPIWIATFKSWGIDPVPLDWAETFNALQQKVVDGQENPYNVLVAQKFYEIQKYVTDIDFIYQTSAILISEKFFQTLPKDLQEAVIKAGKETQAFEWDLADKSIESDKRTITEKGMVLLGRPEDFDEWVKRARSTWPQFYELMGNGDKEKGKQIIETVEKFKAEYEQKKK
ncbi:TRAP transporter substrate-binding protein [Moorella sulfitireducens (nom. illeg.)]|uniref:TRAP transporter substrate-binding protein n=1 Tax=Neomoorella sulfitireducens TaxID=2972948 RepID=UPI0021ACB81A|nr:TRAP transporter substrate-binding protein [Moorella sulfitireducens]